MLDALKSLLPPPVEGPVRPRFSWADAEETLGVRFPNGYKALIDTYGSGTIDEELGVFDPRHTDRYWNLIEGTQAALREAHDEHGEHPLPGFPAPGRRSLLMVGGNGNDIYLPVEDGDAHEGELWIGTFRGLDFLQIPGPFSALLVDVLTRTGSYDRILATFGDIWTRVPVFRRSRVTD